MARAHRFKLLCAPDGSETLLGEPEEPEVPGHTNMVEFLQEFDGSVVVMEFELPPQTDPLYDPEYTPPELTKMQAWVLAKVVQEGFRAGHDVGVDRQTFGGPPQGADRAGQTVVRRQEMEA